MNDDSPVLKDLNALHEHIQAAVRERFGARLNTVGEYDPIDPQLKTIKTPAILLELVEIRPGGRKTGGRTPVKLIWSAHCILSAATPKVQREIRNFAVQMLCLVDGNKWGLGGAVERPAELPEAFPGLFNPGEMGFESWIVNWSQVVHLGDSWELPVDEVYVRESPNIGADHQDDYRRLV